MTAKERLAALRRLMAKNGVQAYVVPSSDPHQSEYVPEFWQRRKFLSGFTGSAGDVAVTRTRAGLWTDSRYWLQAGRQLDKRSFELFKSGLPDVPSWAAWVSSELKKGETLGVDPKLVPLASYRQLKAQLEEKGRRIKDLERNLVDAIWTDRPAPPAGEITILSLACTGESVPSKLRRLRQRMDEEAAGVHVLSQLDAIAWLFNIRGSDVTFNPVVISYAVITRRQAFLFVDLKKLGLKARLALSPYVELAPYEDFSPSLKRLAAGERVWLDEATASWWLRNLIPKSSALVLKPSPVVLFKALKNKTEVRGFRAAHVRDGVAMVKFLCWLDKAVPRGGVSELRAAEMCARFRSEQRLYRGLSFETISSFGPHGAVVHYAVTPRTDIPLKPGGLYIIDSGSQYLDATTDITRTVSFGTPTEEQTDCFTRILRGLISLSTTSFPQGTVGKQLDTVARLPLWDKGLNFIHGTGHGVGAYLNVHEGPHAVSYYRCVGVPLMPGMVTTIEPGFYKEGGFGLRVENIALAVRDEERSRGSQGFLKFETLTLCPIDLRLVKKNLLTNKERAWLNAYHSWVRKTLEPHLTREEAGWLRRATRPL